MRGKRGDAFAHDGAVLKTGRGGQVEPVLESLAL